MWLHDHADTELILLAMHTMCARLDPGSSLTRPAIQKACATASKLADTHSCQWAGSRGQPYFSRVAWAACIVVHLGSQGSRFDCSKPASLPGLSQALGAGCRHRHRDHGQGGPASRQQL